MEKREMNYTFKILSALGMILIVGGHCNSLGLSLFFDWFPPYSFHVALFVFVAGYFYKEKEEENPFCYVKKRFLRLIVPMLIWNFLYGILVSILHVLGFTIGGDFTLYNLFLAPFIDGHQFGFNLCTWFVVPLFFVQFFNVYFRKLMKKAEIKSEIFYLLLYLGVGLSRIKLAQLGYNNGFYLLLTRTMFFLPCYAFGIYYHKKLEKKDTLSSPLYFFILFVIQFLLLSKFEIIVYTPSQMMDFYHTIFLPYITSVTGILFWLRIAKILTPILKENKIMMAISNHTYDIMVHQFLGFMVLKSLFALLSITTPFINGFDIKAYKSNNFYMYMPFGQVHFSLFYCIFAIAFSLFISYITGKTLFFVKQKYKLWKKRRIYT